MHTIIGEDYYSGIKDEFIAHSAESDTLEQLDNFIDSYPLERKLIFLSYDLKNSIEDLTSKNTDPAQFPVLHCIVPIEISPKQSFSPTTIKKNNSIVFRPEISNNEYIERLKKIKEHIQLGDIYETNFCYGWKSKSKLTNPYALFQKLDTITKAPFSVYADLKTHTVLCASPERFIEKRGDKITSQPIKGTAKKVHNKKLDEKIVLKLENDLKERAENIMIVDLVRNDLSKIATKNSVTVDELCKVYSFENIHQLISTVSCKTKKSMPFSAIMKALFPMGSMTGVPKIKAMQLMEKYETTKRGLYSGSIGVIYPNGDFDLNVVIRTLIYNKLTETLCFNVGGAITNDSDPEKEYQETLVKADALIKACK